MRNWGWNPRGKKRVSDLKGIWREEGSLGGRRVPGVDRSHGP